MSEQSENREIRCRELLTLTLENHTKQRGFEGFYKLMYPVIFAYFRKQSVCGIFLAHEEAEDLAQEVLIKIYKTDKTKLRFLHEQIDQESPIKYSCLGWVKTVCYHKFLEKYGQPRENDTNIDENSQNGNIEIAQQDKRKEDHDCFMTILDILRGKHFGDYELILLVTLGYTNEEIGKLLGIKKNVVATRKYEAIHKKLRPLAYRHCLKEKAPES